MAHGPAWCDALRHDGHPARVVSIRSGKRTGDYDAWRNEQRNTPPPNDLMTGTMRLYSKGPVSAVSNEPALGCPPNQSVNVFLRFRREGELRTQHVERFGERRFFDPMLLPYRFDISSQGRLVCANTESLRIAKRLRDKKGFDKFPTIVYGAHCFSHQSHHSLLGSSSRCFAMKASTAWSSSAPFGVSLSPNDARIAFSMARRSSSLTSALVKPS